AGGGGAAAAPPPGGVRGRPGRQVHHLVWDRPTLDLRDRGLGLWVRREPTERVVPRGLAAGVGRRVVARGRLPGDGDPAERAGRGRGQGGPAAEARRGAAVGPRPRPRVFRALTRQPLTGP